MLVTNMQADLSMADPYNFNVRSSSSSSEYIVSVWIEGEQVLCICDCPAGKFGKLCKHKVAILSGDESALSQRSQSDQLKFLCGQVTQRALGKCLLELDAAEKGLDQAKRHLDKVKKELERMIHA